MFDSERVRFSAASPSSPPLSLRERKKGERRKRIENAAYQVFREKGYEAATTREIAARADVGVATLFAYARDKQALLMMIFNDQLALVTASAFASLRADLPFLEQLIHLFEPRYEIFGQESRLSQLAIHFFASFVPDDDDSREMSRFMEHRSQLGSQVHTLVQRGQGAGSIDATVDPALLTALILDVFFNEVREWLKLREPILAEGIAHYAASFR